MFRISFALMLALLSTAPCRVYADQQHISLDIRDLDVYDAVRLLSTQASVNVVVDASVQHRPITLRLRPFAGDALTVERGFLLQVERVTGLAVPLWTDAGSGRVCVEAASPMASS